MYTGIFISPKGLLASEWLVDVIGLFVFSFERDVGDDTEWIAKLSLIDLITPVKVKELFNYFHIQPIRLNQLTYLLSCKTIILAGQIRIDDCIALNIVFLIVLIDYIIHPCANYFEN